MIEKTKETLEALQKRNAVIQPSLAIIQVNETHPVKNKQTISPCVEINMDFAVITVYLKGRRRWQLVADEHEVGTKGILWMLHFWAFIPLSFTQNFLFPVIDWLEGHSGLSGNRVQRRWGQLKGSFPPQPTFLSSRHKTNHIFGVCTLYLLELIVFICSHSVSFP